MDIKLKTLRKEFETISSIDPTKQGYNKLCAYLDARNNEDLKTLRDANIKWVSNLARNRCIRRGI